MKRLIYVLCAVLLCFIEACNINELEFNDVEGPTLGPKDGIPIGYLSYTMRELLDKVDDSELSLEEDSLTSLIQFVYRDTVIFSARDELVSIEDVTNDRNIAVPQTNIATSDTVINISQQIRFSYYTPGEEIIEKVYFEDGQAALTFTQNFAYPITYTATLGNTKLQANGAPMVFTDSSPDPQSLTGYYSDFYFENDSNLFLINIDLSIHVPTGGTLPSGSNVNVELQFTNQDFSFINGQFGNDSIQVSNQTLDINFFSELGVDEIVFKNPNLSFTFFNSFGVPVGVDFGGMYSYREDTNERIYLREDITDDLQIIDGAEDSLSVAVSNVNITNVNSNIDDLLAIAPTEIGFDLNAITNPENANAHNFFSDTSSIRGLVEVKIPLYLTIDSLTKQVDYGIGSGINFDEADSLVLRIISTNELPFTVTFTADIRNDNDSILFQLEESKALQSPFLNVDGSLKQARKNVSDIPISSAGIEALNNGNRIYITIILNTPESQNSKDLPVFVLADYAFQMELSMVGVLNIDL